MAYVARMGSIWSSGAKSMTLGNLPVFAKVRDPDTKIYGNPIIFVIGDHNHTGYPANSVTLVAEKIIKLLPFDGREPSNANADRKSYGNNRYTLSNIRQWLNKSGTSWYIATHGQDTPPSSSYVDYNPYSTQGGFLTGFSEEMIAAALDTTPTVAKANVDGGGSETFTDKIFILSKEEVGLGAENSISEGSLLSMFSATASTRLCMPTAEAVSNSNYTHANLTSSKNWYWCVRSPNAANSYQVRFVDSSGAVGNRAANSGDIGLRQALNLPKNTLVSEEPGLDGVYNIIW